jgi:ATP-dependent DNA helicase RecG
LHGRMGAPQKLKVMQDFKDKKTDILVSTVVVEVGVDVSAARCMVVENAHRFGLAQLHQLRGRVGRGREESYCILFSEADEEESVRRLSVFERTQSGFDIAEQDLAMRGAGEILGKKQHGLPELRIGDLVRDEAIFLRARQEARL